MRGTSHEKVVQFAAGKKFLAAKFKIKKKSLTARQVFGKFRCENSRVSQKLIFGVYVDLD